MSNQALFSTMYPNRIQEISRDSIIAKTCYGLNVYMHVILPGCKEKGNVKVSFPDCGLWPNPFDGYRRSLHITVAQQHPGEKLSPYMATHHDVSNHIPDGDSIDLAGLFYNLQGQSLYEKINEELCLHIGERFSQYEGHWGSKDEDLPVVFSESEMPRSCKKPEQTPEPSENEQSVITQLTTNVNQSHLMSFYKRPVSNKIPEKDMTLRDVYEYLISDQAKNTTEHLRAIDNKDRAKAYKLQNFDYVSPGGTFTRCEAKSLIAASGLIVIDIDHIETEHQLEDMRNTLISIPRLETQLLFRSPSGHGIKWIIEVVNNEGHSHSYYLDAVANYLESFGITIDKSGKDICRPCFLPYDPDAYINPKFLQ